MDKDTLKNTKKELKNIVSSFPIEIDLLFYIIGTLYVLSKEF